MAQATKQDNDIFLRLSQAWTSKLNSVPQAVVQKLYKSGDEIVEIAPSGKHKYDTRFPIWSTMWSFNDFWDNVWLTEEKNRKKMADCGFRIYKQEDYGYIFGIDGAGYDFYQAHWIPLYKEFHSIK